MALNITTIRKINPTHLTIIKKSQIYGIETGIPFLTNRTTRAWATYPIQPDSQYHLNPGDKLQLLEILSPCDNGLDYSELRVMNDRGQDFLIKSMDIARFISL